MVSRAPLDRVRVGLRRSPYDDPVSRVTARPTDVYFFATASSISSRRSRAGRHPLIEREGIAVHFLPTRLLRPACLQQRLPGRSRAVARRQLDLFPSPGRSSCLGSCAAMMRHHYSGCSRGRGAGDKAAALSARIFELTEFLVHVVGFARAAAASLHRRTAHDCTRGAKWACTRPAPPPGGLAG